MKPEVHPQVAHWEQRVRDAASDHERVDTTPASQRWRFRVFAERLPMDRRVSVLDVGCGVAHLWEYLRGAGRDVEYVGVDVTPAMIARARERCPELELHCADILAWEPGRCFDHTVAIGVHNVRTRDARALLEATLRRQFELADVGAHVSLLTDRFAGLGPQAQAWRAEELLALALEITPYVRLEHDYLPHDFSLSLYRAPRADREAERA